ncbi:hypothetical protein N7522_011281 [Penicillium canescens]|nr:hypothetical protein N7522_011281 [Penicillium canescens]
MADIVYVVINDNNANPSQHVSSGEERHKSGELRYDIERYSLADNAPGVSVSYVARIERKILNIGVEDVMPCTIRSAYE